MKIIYVVFIFLLSSSVHSKPVTMADGTVEDVHPMHKTITQPVELIMKAKNTFSIISEKDKAIFQVIDFAIDPSINKKRYDDYGYYDALDSFLSGNHQTHSNFKLVGCFTNPKFFRKMAIELTDKIIYSLSKGDPNISLYDAQLNLPKSSSDLQNKQDIQVLERWKSYLTSNYDFYFCALHKNIPNLKSIITK